MNAKWSKSVLLGCLLTSQLLIQSTGHAASGGAIAGGGGDASEARVNEIRSDILSWIKLGGAEGLNLGSLGYNQYTEGMKDILIAKKVTIGFVNKDHPTDSDLRVSVNGKPKTCRGFIAKDNGPRILCNISRFEGTTEADQYSLIHHEYAGLAGFEENNGASSDYHISNQLTGFLTRQTVLRLAIKKLDPLDFQIPTIEIAKTNYLGDKKFEVTIGLKNTKDVLQVILENGVPTIPDLKDCWTSVPSLNFMNGEVSKTFKLESKCFISLASFNYKKVSVQFIDGSTKNLGNLELNFGLDFKNQSKVVKESILILKEEESLENRYYGVVPVKNVTFKAAYKTTKEAMRDYEGIIFYNGGTTLNPNVKEIFSSDPQVLADAVNSYNEIQEIKLTRNHQIERVCKTSFFKKKCEYEIDLLSGYQARDSYTDAITGVVFIKKGNKGETDVQIIKEVADVAIWLFLFPF